MPDKQLHEWWVLVMTGFFSVYCGWLSYLLKVQEGKQFIWREFFLHGAISAVSGLVCYEILAYQGFPAELCGSLAGVAGWGGTRAIRLAEVVIQKRLGVDREDLK